MHWIQNQSVEHYPTNIIRQLELNPWAEFAITHLQILSRGDYFANLIQWFSMIGSIVGVTLIANKFGASIRGQIVAATVAATIPMGILQSTSTQNDYVVSFWLMNFIYFGMLLADDDSNLLHVFACGASLGIAILTKGTAYIYAFPFILWFIILKLKTLHRKLVVEAAVVILLVFTINMGHYLRNYRVFHNPLNSGEIQRANEKISPAIVSSNIMRNIALHLCTPSGKINGLMEKEIDHIHSFLGINVNSPKSTFLGTTFKVSRYRLHEDVAGNPLHLFLIFLSFGLLLVQKRIRRFNKLVGYSFALVLAFIIFNVALKWNPWNTRIDLPLFVLWSPVVGTIMANVKYRKISNTVIVVLLISSFPCLLFNETRPVIGYMGKKSILTSDRASLYFNNRPFLMRQYLEAASFIHSKNCQDIGLRSTENDFEYPLWQLIKVPGYEKCRIEHLEVKNASAQIPLSNFKPCAEIVLTGKVLAGKQQAIKFLSIGMPFAPKCL
jgi:hypothetical protein